MVSLWILTMITCVLSSSALNMIYITNNLGSIEKQGVGKTAVGFNTGDAARKIYDELVIEECIIPLKLWNETHINEKYFYEIAYDGIISVNVGFDRVNDILRPVSKPQSNDFIAIETQKCVFDDDMLDFNESSNISGYVMLFCIASLY